MLEGKICPYLKLGYVKTDRRKIRLIYSNTSRRWLINLKSIRHCREASLGVSTDIPELEDQEWKKIFPQIIGKYQSKGIIGRD